MALVDCAVECAEKRRKKMKKEERHYYTAVAAASSYASAVINFRYADTGIEPGTRACQA
jgi:hypothetical protein